MIGDVKVVTKSLHGVIVNDFTSRTSCCGWQHEFFNVTGDEGLVNESRDHPVKNVHVNRQLHVI